MAEPGQMLLPLDSPLNGRVKNDRTVMVFNFFALEREKVTELPIYDDGEVKIEVNGNKHGVANIWDKEMLIYIVSLIQERINRGQPVSRRVTFTAHDFFRVCQSSPGGSAYDRVEEMLIRLQGTQIKTNIETGGTGEDGAFSWITDYKLQYRRKSDGHKDARGIEVEICDWLFRAIVRDSRILTYNNDYFKLGPIEKRLYEIARAHCGEQPSFRINIEKLRRRVGSTSELKKFKQRILSLANKRAPLPDYGLALVDPKTFNSNSKSMRVPTTRWQVYFFRRDRMTDLATPEQAPLIDDDV